MWSWSTSPSTFCKLVPQVCGIRSSQRTLPFAFCSGDRLLRADRGRVRDQQVVRAGRLPARDGGDRGLVADVARREGAAGRSKLRLRARRARSGCSSSRTRRSPARSCSTSSSGAPRGRKTEVLVVVPALNTKLKHWVSDEDGARRPPPSASRRRSRRCARFGLEGRGEVGDGDPLQAIEDALRTFAPDEIVISTHPAGRSHWLERGVVEAPASATTSRCPRGRRSRRGSGRSRSAEAG